MRIRMILLGLIIATTGCYAQLTLQECRQKAHDNYPLIKQYDLVERLCDYNIANASVANLPQVSVTGLTTYHTDMIKENLPSTFDTKNYIYGGMLQKFGTKCSLATLDLFFDAQEFAQVEYKFSIKRKHTLLFFQAAL